MSRPANSLPFHPPSTQIAIGPSVFPSTSLGTRLALTYTGLTLLVIGSLGWVIAGTVRDFYMDQLRADLLQEATVAVEVAAPLIGDGGNGEELAVGVAQLSRGLGARVTVVAADGRVLADSQGGAETMDNQTGRPEIQEAFRRGSGSSFLAGTSDEVPYFFVARSIPDGAAVLRLGIPAAVFEGLVLNVQRQIAIAAVLAASIMTGAGLFIAKRIGGALDNIHAQATLIAAGQLDASVEPAATRELGDLGRAFNLMTLQLRGSVTELERIRVRLEATLANLSDGVIITDERGHVVLANQAALSMVGARGVAVGEPVVEVARDHELTDMVNQALATDTAKERIVHHSRSGRVLQAAARRLNAADDRIGLIVLRDITEIRRLESVRRDFVANVSHELRTPLTSIRVLVETLESGALHDPSVSTDFLARIVSEVDRLALLVDELLDLARLESGRIRLSLEWVNAESAVQRVLERMAPQTERARLMVDFSISPETPEFLADWGRIDQVLLNLVHNAVKFTPAGGAIAIMVSSSVDLVQFHVRDTGVGVSPEDMPRLFERFYKADRARRSQGTGLGLAIAKHIVQAHGGTIWAEPNPGGGTSFMFTLPLAGPSDVESH
ncbi:MAG: cell wall metabolism sensor histidine kinase WalK [Chloroflexota bacterium]|nr:cell wall metabolism sensor histidine kinase WalK [Chloroflexota bacterium]